MSHQHEQRPGENQRPGEPEDRAGRRQGSAKPPDAFKLENRIGHLLDTIGLDEIEAAQPRPPTQRHPPGHPHGRAAGGPPGRTTPAPRPRPDAHHREGAD
jgi:hypothetical protein